MAPMMKGTITRAAKAAGLPPQAVWDYSRGSKSAGPERADLMADLTGTDIRLWLRGGDPEARRAALSAWDLAAGAEKGKP